MNLIALLAFISLNAAAHEPISCWGYSTVYEESLDIQVDAAWKNLELTTTIDGDKDVSQNPIIAVRSVNTPADLAGYFACEDERNDYAGCRAFFERGLSKLEIDTLSTLLNFEAWRTSDLFKDSPNYPLYQAVPTLQVKRVEQLVTEEDTGTGTVGLVNLYGAGDVLLARFYQVLEPVPCLPTRR